jgi:hypothetical protein
MAEAYEKNHKTLQIICWFELDTGPSETECAVEINSTLDRWYLNLLVITENKNNATVIYVYSGMAYVMTLIIDDYIVDG